MTVREMLDRMTSRELSEWEAYFCIKDEPVPQDQDAAVKTMKAMLGGPGGKP
jgi:hypothetical protein